MPNFAYSKLICSCQDKYEADKHATLCLGTISISTGFDSHVSAAPCLSGDKLQQSTDGSPGLLVHPVPPAAQQGPACQPAVHSESGHQPGRHPDHSPLLSLVSFQGEMPAAALSYFVQCWVSAQDQM